MRAATFSKWGPSAYACKYALFSDKRGTRLSRPKHYPYIITTSENAVLANSRENFYKKSRCASTSQQLSV